MVFINSIRKLMIFWKSIRTVAPCRSLNGQSSSVRACRRNKAQQLILRLPECIEIAVQVDIGVAISIGYKSVLFYWIGHNIQTTGSSAHRIPNGCSDGTLILPEANADIIHRSCIDIKRNLLFCFGDQLTINVHFNSSSGIMHAIRGGPEK